MGFVGDEMKDFCIQQAFSIMKKRNSRIELKDWYVVLSYLIRNKGEEVLYKYARTVDLNQEDL